MLRVLQYLVTENKGETFHVVGFRVQDNDRGKVMSYVDRPSMKKDKLLDMASRYRVFGVVDGEIAATYGSLRKYAEEQLARQGFGEDCMGWFMFGGDDLKDFAGELNSDIIALYSNQTYGLSLSALPNSLVSAGDCIMYRGCNDAEVAEYEIPDFVTAIINTQGYQQPCEKVKHLILPSSLRLLSKAVFQDMPCLEKLTIRDGVAELSDSCFRGCAELREIVFPAAMERLNQNCFLCATSLEHVYIPCVKYIDAQVFDGCISLQSVELGEGCVAVGDSCFFACKALTDVKLPGTLRTLGVGAFEGCTSLQSIEIPEKVKTLSQSLFEDCESLETVVLHEGLTKIESGCFANCRALKHIIVPDSVSKIDPTAFSGLSDGAVTLHFSDKSAHMNKPLTGKARRLPVENAEIVVDR